MCIDTWVNLFLCCARPSCTRCTRECLPSGLNFMKRQPTTTSLIYPFKCIVLCLRNGRASICSLPGTRYCRIYHCGVPCKVEAFMQTFIALNNRSIWFHDLSCSCVCLVNIYRYKCETPIYAATHQRCMSKD